VAARDLIGGSVPTAEELVAFRAAFERHPAGVKGAFLLRGADGLPHQVRIAAARAAQIGGEEQERIAIDPAILEISPTSDTFVPFDVSTLDLLPGWYRLECEVQVDGLPVTVHPGERFLMAWPRSQVRRGTLSIGETIGGVALGDLECVGDCIRIGYAAEAAPSVRLRVDGRAHPVLDVEHDIDAGSGRIVGYPVLREDTRLAVVVGGRATAEVALP
jgi:hypothetical protein